jgi:hypothetical protein
MDGMGSEDEVGIVPVVKLTGRLVRLAVGVGDDVATRVVESLALSLEGIDGDRHGGFTRPADVRVPWYERGEPIHNERQLTIVSVEDLAEIARRLDLDRVEPEWLGANLLVEGIPRLSALPRGTRLFFSSGAALAVTDQNAPCRLAGGAISAAVGGDDRLPYRFVAAAKRLRGVTAYVDRAGVAAAGDEVRLRVPEQWIWRP